LQVRDLLRNVKLIQCTAAGAFAVGLADGSVITWGNPNEGGDCSAVQDQLRNVQQIQATARSFAAILADRSVVSWGHGSFGGLAVTAL
jgi:alpha-tubulin suppressor-like RCC1 family protein